MPFPVLALCSPPPTTTMTSRSRSIIKLPRPRGLWKAARETPHFVPGSPPPQDDRYHYYVNATVDRENIFLLNDDCCGRDSKKRKTQTTTTTTTTTAMATTSTSTLDSSLATTQDPEEIIFWDYSRKCNPQPERLTKWITRSKVMITSSVASLGTGTGTGTGTGQAAAAAALKQCDRSSSSTCGLEDWEDLKELFSKAVEMYETEEASEAIPVLRGVIHECHRFMRVYPDPSVVYATPTTSSSSQQASKKAAAATMTLPLHREGSLPPEWMVDPPPPYPRPPAPSSGSSASSSMKNQDKGLPLKEKKCQCKDLPTAFYTVFGTTLFLFGNLIGRDPALALQGEPSAPTPYWLSAIDVFQIGENLPIRLSGRGCASAPEDWRMAVVWGRTLVNLADEILTRQRSAAAAADGSPKGKTTTTTTMMAASDQNLFPGMLTFSSVFAPISNNNNNNHNVDEPTWPADSPFALIAVRRPPSSCRLSLNSSTPTELLHLAQDQFYRGIFHMPHQRGTRNQRSPPTTTTSSEPPPSSSLSSTPSSPHSTLTTPRTITTTTTTTSSSSSSTTTPFSQAAQPLASTFSRTKELYTIGSEMLLVAEKLDDPSDRFQWASWADGIFSQMKVEHFVSGSSGGGGGDSEHHHHQQSSGWKTSATTLIAGARGRSCLVMGSARAEEMDGALEAGELGVLEAEEAEEAREVLRSAVAFLERARGTSMAMGGEAANGNGAPGAPKPSSSSTSSSSVPSLNRYMAVGEEVLEAEDEDNDEDEDEDEAAEIQAMIDDSLSEQAEEEEESQELAELRTLLAEALLTLANLTRDPREREELYARAHREGRGMFELDDGDRMDEGD